MSSLPAQKTILDHVSTWLKPHCIECGTGLPLDLIWLRDDWTSANDAHKCARHAIAGVHEAERPSVAAALVRAHEMHGFLRLADDRVRKALRSGLFPPTLFGYRALDRLNGCDIDIFDVRGLSRENAAALAPTVGIGNLPVSEVSPLPPELFAEEPWVKHFRGIFPEYFEATVTGSPKPGPSQR